MPPRIITRRQFLQNAAYAGLAVTAASAFPRIARAEATRKPNLLFVFADQHRSCSMGCYGDDQVQTPNFDAFAKQGMRCDAALSNTPVCVPYRASLLTGVNCAHLDVKCNPDIKKFKPDLAKTLAKTFKNAGYDCGYVGKWHANIHPEKMGFTDYYAFNDSEHSYFKWTYHQGPKDKKNVTGEGFFRPQMEADQALAFMRERKDKPFCLFMSWGPPHTPYEQCPEKYAHYKDLKRRPNVPGNKHAQDNCFYNGLIEGLDVEFGRLMGELDKMGLADNTIVVYTSDHGDMMGSQGLIRKYQPYKESLEVPFLVRYPKHVPAGATTDAIIGVHDVFPTLASLAGVAAPAGLDGMDLAPVLLGKSDAKRQPHSYITISEGRATWRGVRNEQYTYARKADGPWVLFDRKADPYEMKNLVKDNPKALKELDELTAAFMKDYNDPFPAASAKPAQPSAE